MASIMEEVEEGLPDLAAALLWGGAECSFLLWRHGFLEVGAIIRQAGGRATRGGTESESPL